MTEGLTAVILAGGKSRRMAPPPAAGRNGPALCADPPSTDAVQRHRLLHPSKADAAGGGVGRDPAPRPAEAGLAQDSAPQAQTQGATGGLHKAFLPWRGTTLLEHVMETLRPLVNELIVSVDEAHRFRHLDARIVEDLVPGAHALGGLYSGLKAAAHPRCFVCACDMPFLHPALIRFLDEQAAGFDAVVPQTPQGLQPLHAVYAKSALPAVAERLRGSSRDLLGLLAHLRVRIVTIDEMRPFDPTGRSFLNVNTPADYLEAQHVASSGIMAR